jgi:hypothetical protein
MVAPTSALGHFSRLPFRLCLLQPTPPPLSSRPFICSGCGLPTRHRHSAARPRTKLAVSLRLDLCGVGRCSSQPYHAFPSTHGCWLPAAPTPVPHRKINSVTRRLRPPVPHCYVYTCTCNWNKLDGVLLQTENKKLPSRISIYYS